MRPRIVGATARLIVSFQGEDENVADTTDRLLRDPLTKETIMGTLAQWEFSDDFTPKQIRPRISEATADRIEIHNDGDEAYSETIDRMLFAGEWDGIDVEGFEESGYGDPYVNSVQDFAAWYDKGRPPSAYDVEGWLTHLSERFEESTVRRHYHAIKAYFKYEIGDWDEKAEPPTRDELIASLEYLADDLGKTPTTRDVFNADDEFPGIHHFQNEFGTWNDALRAAGFEPNEEKSGEYTDEELIEDLREFAAEIEDVPTSSQMVRDGPHSTSTYINRFGSWSDALEAADLKLEERYSGGERAEAMENG